MDSSIVNDSGQHGDHLPSPQIGEKRPADGVPLESSADEDKTDYKHIKQDNQGEDHLTETEMNRDPCSDCQKLRSDFESLQKENGILRSDCKKLQAQCQALCNQIADLQSNKPQQTPDEEEITALWHVLVCAVTNLTTYTFNGYPIRRALKSQQVFFGTLTPKFNDYLTTNSKSLFIEGAIWRLLVDRLLKTPVSAYQDEAAEAVFKVRQIIMTGNPPVSRDAIRPLNYLWRAQTGQILHMVYGDKGDYSAETPNWLALVNDMISYLERFSSSLDPDSLRNQFVNIIDKAVALARLIARSESRYVVLDRFLGQEFKEEAMEDVSNKDDSNGTVEFVVSPALLKFVLPQGKTKEERNILSKARVVRR